MAGGASAQGRGEGTGGTPVLTLPLAGCVTQAREPPLWASNVASSTWTLPLLSGLWGGRAGTVCDGALGLGCVCSRHAGGSGGHSPCLILLLTAARWGGEEVGTAGPAPPGGERGPPEALGRGLWPGRWGRVAAGDLPGGLPGDVQEHRLLHGGPSAPAGGRCRGGSVERRGAGVEGVEGPPKETSRDRCPVAGLETLMSCWH